MIRWILCLLFDHVWEPAGRGLPDSASPGEYSKCARCGEDSRKWWEIEDDTLCRLERLHLLLKKREACKEKTC